MAAREFHGIILNLWDRDLRHAKSDVDSGEWQGNWEPFKETGAGRIEAGQQREWRSESAGIMTGTSGWARWSISIGGARSEFVQVNWSIPFYGQPTVTCGVFRHDPDSPPFRPDPLPPSVEIVFIHRDEDGNPVFPHQSERDQPALAQAASIAPYFLTLPGSFFFGPPWFITHPRVGFIVRGQRSTSSQGRLTFPSTGVSHEQVRMQTFRFRMDQAVGAGFLGGFPNFYEATYGIDTVGGTIFVKPSAAEWRDVPHAELDHVPLDDFGARMRATNAYATRNGFVGGFPTYYHADYGNGVVCGTVLLTAEGAEWRDVARSELGGVSTDDVEGRFRATQDYANRNGFVGGFPNMFHADPDPNFPTRRETVFGTVLLKPSVAEWRDVVIFRGPS